MTTYGVHVTREGHQWLAEVPGLEGTQTYAPNLTALDRYVREIIVLAEDLPAAVRGAEGRGQGPRSGRGLTGGGWVGAR